MQVAGVGIRFDYKKEHRRFWQYCTLAMMITIILIIVSYKCYSFRRSNHLIDMVEHFTSVVPQNCSLIQISVSFHILLCSIYKRFAALNSVLRYGLLFNIYVVFLY